MASARKHRDKWVVDYKDEAGRKRTKGGFKTDRGPAGAKAWAEDYNAAARRGPDALTDFLDTRLLARAREVELALAPSTDSLVLDDLAARFFRELAPGTPTGLASSTHATYLSMYESHIKPHDGGTRLSAFAGPDAPIAWRDSVLATGIGDQAYLKAKTCLSSMLSYGVEKRLLVDNGVRRMPQRSRRRSARAKTVLVYRPKDALSPVEVAGIVDWFLSGGRYQDALAVELGFLLGLRPQEWWALRYLHTAGPRVIVEQVISLDGLQAPKTREIFPPIPQHLREQLAHRKKRLGAQPQDFIFPGAAPPGHLTPDQMRNWRTRTFKHACREVLGRNVDGPYALRRGHISVRAGRGEPVALIAAELGTSVKMIHGHYEKVIAHADDARESLLQQYLRAIGAP